MDGPYDWSGLDQALALAQKHGKQIGISFVALMAPPYGLEAAGCKFVDLSSGRVPWINDSATATATFTPTPSATLTPTATATLTPTVTATLTPTATATFTPTPTATYTPTPTATLAPTPTSTPAPTPTASPALIYGVVYMAKEVVSASILNNPNVDAVAAGADWSEIEQTKDHYDFTALDAVVAMVEAAGKPMRFELTVGGGDESEGGFKPEWLKDLINNDGFQSGKWFTYRDSSCFDKVLNPTPTIPVFWGADTA